MKRKPTNVKKTIKKRIEHSQSKYKYIEKSGQKTYGKPIDVDLVMDSSVNRRSALRRGVKSPSKYSPVLVDKQPISIIVTAYKAQDYIEECLNSIEGQTYFIDNNDFEVIVGVDACQETLNKLLEIKHKYRNLRILMMNKNRGTYVTSNTIIRQTKNENIIRFDSDDVMLLEMVNEIMHFQGTHNVIRLKYHKLVGSQKTLSHAYAHGVLYITRTVFNQLGGYRGWRCAADTELLRRGKSIIIEKYLSRPVFLRRMHGNSLTAHPEFGAQSVARKKYRKIIREGKFKEIKIRRVTSKYVEY